MTIRRLAAGVLLAGLAFTALPAASRAFDLTGRWEGKWSCQGFDGASFKSSNPESVLLVTQNGDTIAARIDGVFDYNGGAIAAEVAPNKQGEAALVQCATDNLPHQGGESEILRAKVKVDPEKGTGSFKGVAVLESDFPDVLTCKYSYKRVSTTDPNLSACP